MFLAFGTICGKVLEETKTFAGKKDRYYLTSRTDDDDDEHRLRRTIVLFCFHWLTCSHITAGPTARHRWPEGRWTTSIRVTTDRTEQGRHRCRDIVIQTECLHALSTNHFLVRRRYVSVVVIAGCGTVFDRVSYVENSARHGFHAESVLTLSSGRSTDGTLISTQNGTCDIAT